MGRQKKTGSYDAFLCKEVYDLIPPIMLTNKKWDSETILKLAKIQNCSVDDLCGLDTENDPFFCGARENHRQKAEWIAHYWPELMRLHHDNPVSTRTIHYYLASIKAPFYEGYDGMRYEKKKNREKVLVKPEDWYYKNTADCVLLCNTSVKYARYLKLIPDDKIYDQKTSEIQNFTDSKKRKFFYNWVSSPDLPSLSIPDLDVPRIPSLTAIGHTPQDFQLILFDEKSTMNMILVPLAKEYEAVFLDLSGEASSTRARQIAKAIVEDGRPARVGYISDYDPAGENMVRSMAVKIQHALIELGAFHIDVQVFQIALTQEQIELYNLELIDLKESDMRAKKFAEGHGQTGEKPQGAELDTIHATHPDLLALLVRQWLDSYYDHTLDGRVKEVCQELDEEHDQITEEALEEFQDEIQTFRKEMEEVASVVKEKLAPLFGKRDDLWRRMNEKLEGVLPDHSRDDLPNPEYQTNNEIALYDSRRPCIVQNLFYQAHKNNIPLADIIRQIDESGLGWSRQEESA